MEGPEARAGKVVQGKAVVLHWARCLQGDGLVLQLTERSISMYDEMALTVVSEKINGIFTKA